MQQLRQHVKRSIHLSTQSSMELSNQSETVLTLFHMGLTLVLELFQDQQHLRFNQSEIDLLYQQEVLVLLRDQSCQNQLHNLD